MKAIIDERSWTAARHRANKHGKLPLQWATTIPVMMFFVLLCSIDVPAFSASFDCSKAKTVMEKTICSDQRLSALDEELAKLYKEIKTQMRDNPSQLDALIKSQREWLTDIKPLKSPSEALVKSLIMSYQARIEELRKELARTRPTQAMQGLHIEEALNNELNALFSHVGEAKSTIIESSSLWFNPRNRSKQEEVKACSQLFDAIKQKKVSLPPQPLYQALKDEEISDFYKNVFSIAKKYLDKTMQQKRLGPEARSKTSDYSWAPNPIEKSLQVTKKEFEREWKIRNGESIKIKKGLVHLLYRDQLMSNGDPAIILASFKLKAGPEWLISRLYWKTFGSDGLFRTEGVLLEEGDDTNQAYLNTGLMSYQGKILVWKMLSKNMYSVNETMGNPKVLDYAVKVYGINGLLNQSSVDESCFFSFDN